MLKNAFVLSAALREGYFIDCSSFDNAIWRRTLSKDEGYSMRLGDSTNDLRTPWIMGRWSAEHDRN